MPTPQRVYCDFSDGDGNFYQYIGNLMDNVIINFYKA